MEGLTITRRGSAQAGEYRAHVAGSNLFGRLTWIMRDGRRIAEHTIVPPELAGRGVAAALVDALISDAREHEFKIEPRCSYVGAAFKIHPDWNDVLAGEHFRVHRLSR